MKRLILYDLDGTLVDTREDIARAANHMVTQLGRAPITAQEVASYVGKGMRHLVKSCLKTDDEKEIERGGKIYRTHYAGHMLDHSKLYPGAKDVLDYFKSRQQAVITNKPNPFSRDLLKALGVANYFIEIVGGDSDYAKKPDPAAVHAIMRAAKVSPEETLFVGDSLIDIQTSRNAGIEVVVLTHGFELEKDLIAAKPDGIFSSFAEFLKSMKTKER